MSFSLLGLLMAASFLCPYMVFSRFTHTLCVSSSYKDTSHIGLGPPPHTTTSLSRNILFKDFISKWGRIQGTRVGTPACEFEGNTIEPITKMNKGVYKPRNAGWPLAARKDKNLDSALAPQEGRHPSGHLGSSSVVSMHAKHKTYKTLR